MARPTKMKPTKLTEKGGKKKRWRPGTVAGRDIKKLQRTVNPLVNKSAIRKCVLAAAQTAGKSDIRFKKTAVEALREAASSFLVDFFDASNKVRHIEGKNKTLQLSHTQIGRATMNVPCLSDTWAPMSLPLGNQP